MYVDTGQGKDVSVEDPGCPVAGLCKPLLKLSCDRGKTRSNAP
jgi:hypothetical protein